MMHRMQQTLWTLGSINPETCVWEFLVVPDAARLAAALDPVRRIGQAQRSLK
jgi:hypothetical protein